MKGLQTAVAGVVTLVSLFICFWMIALLELGQIGWQGHAIGWGGIVVALISAQFIDGK